jgi:hypothetical protein
VICFACDREERIQDYIRTGELGSQLVMEAVLADDRIGDPSNRRLAGLRQDVVMFYYRHEETLREIASKNRQIVQKARELGARLAELDRYYQASDKRGHSGETDTYKALLWGSAGRVLLTLQDRERPGKFGGAWVTLIFAEGDPAKNGVHGYCGTFEEVMDLLSEATENFPEMKPNSDVSFV